MGTPSTETRSRSVNHLRHAAGAICPIIFAWSAQIVTGAIEFLAIDFPARSFFAWLLAFLILYPLFSVLAIAYIIGLMSAYFWHDLPRPREAAERDLFSVLALATLPLLLAFFWLSPFIYLFLAISARRGLNFGWKLWPKRPWEIWLDLRPPDFKQRVNR